MINDALRFTLTRAPNLKPRLVRVTGHFGEPWWGVVVSRKYRSNGSDARDVVIIPRPRTAHTLHAHAPKRVMCFDRYIRPGCLTTEPDDVARALLAAFVAAGTLTRAERRTILAERRKALQPLTYRCKGVTQCHGDVGRGKGPPHISNALGANTVMHDWRRKSGVW